MEKLIGNLNLKSKEGQSLYHSQLYGTFFGVYAVVDTLETPNNNDFRKINSMTLRVVNYKGILNLGIEKATYQPDKNDPTKGGTIYLIMRGMSEKTKNINVDGIEGQVVEKEKARINIQRKLRPLFSNDSNDNIPLCKGAFDEEFHYREGRIDIGNTLRGMNDPQVPGSRPAELKDSTLAAMNGKYPKKEAVSASGWFCPYAELVLLWI